jgi:hypothetical protein
MPLCPTLLPPTENSGGALNRGAFAACDGGDDPNKAQLITNQTIPVHRAVRIQPNDIADSSLRKSFHLNRKTREMWSCLQKQSWQTKLTVDLIFLLRARNADSPPAGFPVKCPGNLLGRATKRRLRP